MLLSGVLLTGCSGPTRPADPAPEPVSTASVAIPADGIALAAYGLVNGPVRQLSIPRTARIRVEIDQTNNVAAVIGEPPAAEVFAYLQQALPRTGFTVTAADPATLTLTFTGYGWTGRFTGDRVASAVLLRPS